ncbi:ArsC family reductase [Candidatus Sororendozoicomonas aggregata]|uniref:ArsC family reductase n=1 Tax=Candidatus Sororendozoicomonas aggregata TaxID=3073239 RepID=UPI002ED5325E
MITLYGISGCDTMRKTRRWLKDANIDYHFHDYRKEGLDPALLRHWLTFMPWEALVNKRGTTWRALPEEQKNNLTPETAIPLILENPAMIKRPLLDLGEAPILGFDPERYTTLFTKRTF